jgi:Lrp/AsnC ligand binding domain
VTTAYILVGTELGAHEEVHRKLEKLASVRLVERIQGDFDLIVHFAGSVSELNAAVSQIIRAPAVTVVRTCVGVLSPGGSAARRRAQKDPQSALAVTRG